MNRFRAWLSDRLWFSYAGRGSMEWPRDLGLWTSRGIHLFGRNWTLWRRR